MPFIVHVQGWLSVTYGVRDGRSRFTVVGTGAKVQNSKSLRRKKLITHLLKSVVGITLIYSAERIPQLGRPWVTS